MPNDLFRGQFDKVPHAWQLVPLKMLMNVESGKEVIVEVHEGENAVPVYGSGLFPFKFTDRSISSRRAIVFGRKGTIGQPYLVSPPYWLVDTAYSAIPKKGVVLQYLYFLLSVFDWQPFVTNTAKPSLVANDILAEKVPCPPVIEQEKIVEFLESKTAEIDTLIEKLSLQVELLERYRRELIARTVTRGLDPDVPMKDSGIDWIDKAPAAWKTASISVVTDENKAKNADLSEKNLLSLSYGRVIRKDIDLAFGLLPASFDSYQIVEPGYIVLRMTDLQNDKRSLRSALAEERGIITSAYIGLKVRGPIVSKYLAWLLRFYDLAKVFYSLGGGVRQSANYEEISKIPILVPPEDEQQNIADFLEEKSAQIESTIKGIKRQIELLGRYRKQVINDLVTGKVRVGEVE